MKGILFPDKMIPAKKIISKVGIINFIKCLVLFAK